MYFFPKMIITSVLSLSVGNQPISQEEEEGREEEERGKKRGELKRNKERGAEEEQTNRRTNGQSFYMSHGKKPLFGQF